MPYKNGAPTPQELIFAKVYAETGSAPFASHKAKYSHSDKVAAQIAKRPAVQRLTREHIARRLLNDIAPKALSRIEEILDDDKADRKHILAAAKLAITETRQYLVGEAADKAAEDMTPVEIQARMAHLRALYAGLSDTPIEDAEVIPDEGDIFG